MGELLGVSVPALLGAVVVFSIVPEFVLQLAVLLYPPGHPRRRELIAELAARPRWERPFLAAELMVASLFEGAPLRIAALWRRRRGPIEMSSRNAPPALRTGGSGRLTVGTSDSVRVKIGAGPDAQVWEIGTTQPFHLVRVDQSAPDETTRD